jgi:PadR family transcriptional regulator, regulatory protein PadR
VALYCRAVKLYRLSIDTQGYAPYPMHRTAMYRMNFKGTLPTLVLETLTHEPSHGYRIAQRIKERSEGVLDFKEGTLYPALHKLENEGLVQSYEGIEKGRPRRYYRITQSGRATLTRHRAEWREHSRVVTLILGGA